AGRQRAQHALHALGIRTRSFRLLLRATQLGRRHHLHGGGDLLRGFHAADADLKVLEAWHVPPLIPGGPSDQANDFTNAVRMLFSFSSVALLSSRSLRMASRTSACLARTSFRNAASKRFTSVTWMVSRKPRTPAKIETTCSSTGIGWNWPCFRSSVRREPRASSFWVEASRSEANCANAAISRYCASSSLILPAT